MNHVKNEYNSLRDYGEQLQECYKVAQGFLLNPINECDGLTITELSQSKYEALCNYIGLTLYQKTGILYDQDGQFIPSAIVTACDVYIYFCKVYDKIPSIDGFVAWCGSGIIYTIYNTISNNIDINYTFIKSDNLDRSREGITTAVAYVKNALCKIREATLKDRLTQTRQAVGVLAIGNQEYNWEAKTKAENVRAEAIALRDLPRLALGENG